MLARDNARVHAWEVSASDLHKYGKEAKRKNLRYCWKMDQIQ